MPLSAQMIGLRFSAAAQVAGIESRVTAHFGTSRVGVGVDEPWCVDHRRHAGRELEDFKDGWPTTLPVQPQNAVPWRASCKVGTSSASMAVAAACFRAWA